MYMGKKNSNKNMKFILFFGGKIMLFCGKYLCFTLVHYGYLWGYYIGHEHENAFRYCSLILVTQKKNKKFSQFISNKKKLMKI